MRSLALSSSCERPTGRSQKRCHEFSEAEPSVIVDLGLHAVADDLHGGDARSAQEGRRSLSARHACAVLAVARSSSGYHGVADDSAGA